MFIYPGKCINLPFEGKLRRATAHLAQKRNKFVAPLADGVFVAHATPGSKTERFCRDVLAKGSARPKRFNEPPRGGHRVLLYCLVGDDGVVYSRLAKRGEPLLATGGWPHEKDLVYHAV